MLEDAQNEQVEELDIETTQDDQNWETEAGGELDTQEPVQSEDPKAKTEEYYQTKYQKQKASEDEYWKRLNAVDPSGYLTAVARGEAPPAPPDEYQTVGEMSTKEYLKLQQDLIRNEVRNSVAALEYERAQAARFNTANQTLIDYRSEHGINDAQHEALMREVAEIVDLKNGDPIAAAKAYLKVHRLNALSGHQQKQVDAVAASAKAKLEAVNQLQQPRGASIPDQPKKTKEQEILEKMNIVGGNDAAKEVFG